MRNSILTILVCFLFSFNAIISKGESLPGLETFLTPAQCDSLKNKGELKQAIKGPSELTLIPQCDQKNNLAETVKKLAPTVGLEYLLLYKPSLPASQSATTSFADLQLRISNALRAISSLKGIEYYSASRKKIRTFFYDAYVIDSPTTKKRLSDPQVKTVPDHESIFIFSNDSSMGDNISKVTYNATDQYLSMAIENYTTISIFFIPAIQPGDLKTFLFIIPTNEGLLFYGLSCIKTINFFGMAEEKGEQSTYNRLVAFFKWFKTNYEK